MSVAKGNMSNLSIPAEQWLKELFEYEYCAECGGDAVDHEAVEFNGNWFARCLHPLPVERMSEEQVEQEMRRRHKRKEQGMSLISA
jgi:hypothetical protein